MAAPARGPPQPLRHLLRTPTRTPTGPIPRVSVAVRRCAETAVTCTDRASTHTCEHRYFDWGSSGRRFKSCQPDHRTVRSEAVSEKLGAAFFLPPAGMYSNRYSNQNLPGSQPEPRGRPSAAARAVSSDV